MWGILTLLAVGGCRTWTREALLAGKECQAGTHACARGYECEAATFLCVPIGSVGTASAGDDDTSALPTEDDDAVMSGADDDVTAAPDDDVLADDAADDDVVLSPDPDVVLPGDDDAAGVDDDAAGVDDDAAGVDDDAVGVDDDAVADDDGQGGLDAGADDTPPIDPGQPCSFSPFAAPELLTGLPGSSTFWGSSTTVDGERVIYGLNRNNDELVRSATRSDRGFALAAGADVGGINSNGIEGSPFLSADGQDLYFFSTRSNPQSGNRDLWHAKRTGDAFTFEGAAALPELNTFGADEMPWLTDDQLTIVFTSDRSEGKGAHDLWQAERESKDSPFGDPVNLAELNTALNEESASFSPDMLTVFFASGPLNAPDAFDIYTARRNDRDEPFSAATKVTELNSGAQELYPAISHDGREIMFSSNRGGTNQLWRALRSCN